MHLYVNFQMGHLDTLKFSPKNSEVTSNQLTNLPPQTHHLKNPKWTLYLLQNSPQLCPNSALKKYLQHPIIHTQNLPYLHP
jgi:hypothetical protein